MEKQINLLVDLAKRYVEYGKEVNLPDTWTYLLGSKFHIYFADNQKSQSVEFGDFQVSFYSNKISMPIDTTVKKLNDLYNEAKSFLEIDLQEGVEAVKEKAKLERLVEIRLLESQLNELKALQNESPVIHTNS